MARKHILPCGNIVTDQGEVFSRLGHKLKIQKSNAGYLRVELWSGGYGKKHSIHRLVASAFVENPENKPHVNHIDGNKENNCAENLEWVTRSENQIHAYRSGLQKGFRKSGGKLSEAHKAALCGSRWKGESRVYIAGGMEFDKPEKAAEYFGVNRQTFYNRAASPRFPDWSIKKWREEK